MRRAAPRGCEGDEPRDPHTIGGPIRPGSASALKVNTPGNLLSVFALQAAAPVGYFVGLPVEIPLEGETTRGSAAIRGGGGGGVTRTRAPADLGGGRGRRTISTLGRGEARGAPVAVFAGRERVEGEFRRGGGLVAV